MTIIFLNILNLLVFFCFFILSLLVMFINNITPYKKAKNIVPNNNSAIIMSGIFLYISVLFAEAFIHQTFLGFNIH